MMNYSFIIPVYNCKSYLPACVESIRAVDAQGYEILLIDDGSTDSSGEVCDALAEKYPEIRVIHQTNSGVSAARNRGIREACGEKLLFLDADDTIDSDALSTVLADPRCNEADLIIYGIRFDYYSNGECYRSDSLYFDWDGILDGNMWVNRLSRMFECNALSSMCTKIFKRSILIQQQLELDTDMFLYEDLEFLLRYLRNCGKIWNVPQAIYHYRQSEDEGNAGRRVARIASLAAFLRPIESALEQLCQSNPALDCKQKDTVLQQLYLVLAREKVSVSDIAQIREICHDFQQWSASRMLPIEASKFQLALSSGSAKKLYLMDKKTKIRHWIAVRVKAFLKGIKR